MIIKNLSDCFEHAQTIAKWHHQEWGYLNPGRSFDMRLERMQRFLNQALLPSMWVATDDHGAPLATAGIVEFDMDDHKHLSPWLASVYVDPQHRKGGIGRTMVEHVMQTSKNAGHAQLYLFTPDQAPWYSKMGWQLHETCTYHDIPVTVMSFQHS
jgi:predicted N-acetyltransferase YhbS